MMDAPESFRGHPPPSLPPLSPSSPSSLPVVSLPPPSLPPPGGLPLPPPPQAMPLPPPPPPGSLGELSPGVQLDEEAFWAVHEMMLADEGNGLGGPPGGHFPSPPPPLHHLQQQHPGGYDTFLLDPVTGQLQLQSEEEGGGDDDDGSDCDGTSDDDDDEEEDDDDASGARGGDGGSFVGGAEAPFHLPPSILGSHLSRLRPRNGNTDDDGKNSGMATRRGKGRGGVRRGRGGGAKGGGGRGPMDEQQLTRRLRQKAESYERKKNRAKAGRKVLKERFETLLKACGDARIRRSDKVGLLTRAIDLITGLRKQLATVKGGGGGGGGNLAPTGLDIDDGGGGGAAPLTRRDSKKRGARDRRAHQHHQQEYHHSAAEASTPVLARAGSKKLAAAVLASTAAGAAEGPVDAVVRCFAATPKAAFAVLGCLGPRTLAAGRAVSRAWRYWHSQALPWRELCRRRWHILPNDGPALEELAAALPLPPASATWREVYAFHHRARLPPRGPFVPTPQSTLIGNRLLLAHASGNGMAAWLFLGPLPPKPTPPLLLPFRLLLQNVAHDVACLPYQRLRLVVTPSADVNGVDGALTRARTISNVSVGTSHAVGSSSGRSSSSSDNSDGDFFLEDDEEEGKGKGQQQRKKHGGEACPCVVACNERRMEGKERIPWRRFKDTEDGSLRLSLFDTAVLSLPLPLPAGCPDDTPLPTALLATAAEMAVSILIPGAAPKKEQATRLVLTLGSAHHTI